MFLHVETEDSDQTGQMTMLILSFCLENRSFCWFCHALAHICLHVHCCHGDTNKQDEFSMFLNFLHDLLFPQLIISIPPNRRTNVKLLL